MYYYLLEDLRCPGDPLSEEYVRTVPALTHANLDFVGVVNRQLETKNQYRFFSVRVSTYAGKDGNRARYDDFDFCCVLTPGERWKRVEPRTGRTIQVQGVKALPSLFTRPTHFPWHSQPLRV
jgi:hypothetical protein